MLKLKKAAWLIMLMPFAHPAWSADDLISSQLADEARAWQQKNRDDLAADLWRKLLRSDPNHPEALVRLGMIELRAGNIKAAEMLHQRARRLSPPPAELFALTAALDSLKQQAKTDTRPASEPLVQTKPPARVEARPEPDKKIAQQPPRLVDLGEYQTESAINANWEETRRSLEQLVRTSPGNKNYLFALARHLTHREATRREAIRLLSSLPLRGPDLRKVWRQALSQLDARGSDVPLFEAYLQRFQHDAEMAGRLAALRQDHALASGKQNASRSAGDVAATVAAPHSTGFHSGNPQGKAGTLLNQALADQRNAAYGAAAAKLESAMLLDPANVRIRLLLARQYERLGAIDSAATLLDDVLAANPDLPEALHARASLFGGQQRWLEGLQMLERIPAAQRVAGIARDQRLMWFNLQLQHASQLYDKGNTGQAASLIERMKSEAGADDGLLGLVAVGWFNTGQPAQGLRLMREVLSRSPADNIAIRVQYAEMLLHALQDAELAAVLRDLAQPGRLDVLLQQQVNRIILSYTLRRVEALRESGRIHDARAMMMPVIQHSEDTRVLLTMARIHLAASEPDKGLALVEKAIARQPDNLGHRLLAIELAIAANTLEKAASHTRAALEITPNHPRALAAAGQVEKMRNNLPKAIEFAQRAHAKEQDPSAFTGAPRQLRLRLVEKGPATLQPGIRTPATNRPGLLPIPDPGTQRPPIPPAGAARLDLIPQLPVPADALRAAGPEMAPRIFTGSEVQPPHNGSFSQRPLLYQQPSIRVGNLKALPGYFPISIARPVPVSAGHPAGSLQTDQEDQGIRLKLTSSLKIRGTARAAGTNL